VSDVALLKIDAKNLPYLTLGNSDNIVVGEWAIAFGNPFGLFDKNSKPTVTVGVISNTNISFIQQDQPSNRVYKGMLQTDAAISSGNSGGPLVNALGEVVGMNTVIFSTAQNYSGAGSIGIGFAIPINRVKKIVEEIKKNKTIDRDYYIGMEIREIDEQIASYIKSNMKEGAVVFSVERRSPADKAGIEPGDIVLKVNGTIIHKAEDYYVEIGDMRTGDKVKLELLRGDEKLTKSFTLESNKKER
jgi:serine protease Do